MFSTSEIVLAAMANGQDLRLKPLAFAALAGRIHIFEKVHFQFFDTRSFATLTSAPSALKEKWLGVNPWRKASRSAANSCLISSKALRYVTGLDRGVRPMGC